jgi:glucan 1,3-beta-glucosidase
LPANEPSVSIPFEVIQEFYWRSLQIVHRVAPHWTMLFHDSFRLSPAFWIENEFLAGCSSLFAVDTHLYLAWDNAHDSMDSYASAACQHGDRLRSLEKQGLAVVVGEWSLATDNCAMWINGLNDNGNK